MSGKAVFAIALLALLVVPIAAQAQEDETEPPYVYGTYFECDINGQWRADEIVKNNYAPIFEAAMAEKTISSWGWLSHHTGGKWRRLRYFTAPSMDALLDAADAVNSKIGDEYPQASREFSGICNTHDDYIWQVGGGSAGMEFKERAAAGFSTYMICDMPNESRADELVNEVFGPVYDKQIAAGNLVTWGWLKHIVGGKWRRIATMSAPDHKSLMKARSAIISEIGESHKAEGKEFNEICGSHQDYMWDITIEQP